MVVIRLARTGAKKKPFYHIVAADKRSARDSRYIERLGYYNPSARGANIMLKLEMERIDHWLGQGAQPSDRVNKLIQDFKKAGVPEIAGAANDEKIAARAKVKTAKKEADAKAKAAAEAKAKAEEEAAAAAEAANNADATEETPAE